MIVLWMGHWCDMHLSLQNGDTPLMVALQCRHDGCVQLLLNKGAQVNHQDKVSALFKCKWLNRSQFIETLGNNHAVRTITRSAII